MSSLSVQTPVFAFVGEGASTSEVGRQVSEDGSWKHLELGPGSDPPLGDDVLAAKGPGGTPFHGAGIRGYRVDGAMTPTIVSAFPEHVGSGATVAAGDVLAGGDAEVLAGPGRGAGFPPEVRGFDKAGAPLPGLDILAYGTGGYGVEVGAGRIDAGTRLLTGPGPAPVFGPHVRAFGYDGTSTAPLAKVSFYAYGTLRFGVGVAASDIDGDGFEEIVTGAGPGEVFGPHVRGWDYDGVSLRAMARVSFFAYGTLRWGVRVGAGDVEGDGHAELLTGPGPSVSFWPQLRAFDYDGAQVAPIARINAVVLPGAYGLHVAAGDLETDGYDEVVCGGGPDPQQGARLRAFDAEGPLAGIGKLDLDVYGVSHGLRVAAGAIGY